MEEITPELILNWDQMGIKIVPSSQWTMVQQGAKRVKSMGISDKWLITAVICGSLVGDLLPVQVTYKGKTSHCHPRFFYPLDWHITHSPQQTRKSLSLMVRGNKYCFMRKHLHLLKWMTSRIKLLPWLRHSWNLTASIFRSYSWIQQIDCKPITCLAKDFLWR